MGSNFFMSLPKFVTCCHAFSSCYPKSCELVFQWNDDNFSLALISSRLNIQSQNQTTHLLLHVQFVKLLASKSFCMCIINIHKCCCWSVGQSCLTVCHSMNCITVALPDPHHLLEFAQVHVHCICDVIQASQSLMPSSLSALNLSQHQGLFQWVSCLIHIDKGFLVGNEADVFLEFPCFFYDPTDVGNFISGSSAFSKSTLHIWNFSVHVLLKNSLKGFEHYFTSMWSTKLW